MKWLIFMGDDSFSWTNVLTTSEEYNPYVDRIPEFIRLVSGRGKVLAYGKDLVVPSIPLEDEVELHDILPWYELSQWSEEAWEAMGPGLARKFFLDNAGRESRLAFKKGFEKRWGPL